MRRAAELSLLLAGGGTAGHIEPALALADTLRAQRPRARITLLGTNRGLETTLVPERGHDLALIPPVPLPRRVTPALLGVPTRTLAAVREAVAVIDRVRADVVVGFGGYVALPAYLAARRRRVPLVVHEANVRPGLANRIGARLTAHVAVATADTSLPGARVVGLPLRPAIATLDRVASRPAARAELGLEANRPTLLVTGGSQGARSLNRAVLAAAPTLADAGIQVLHLAGRGHVEEVSGSRNGLRHVVLPYLDRMDLAYGAADLVLCRAGAMTCAELTAVGLPAAYVPLPIGNGEQRLNAAAIVAAGGGLEVADGDLDAAWLRTTVLPLLTDPERLAAMGAAAARFGHRDADVALAGMAYAAAGDRCLP